MILTGKEIEKQVNKGRIQIGNFDIDRVTTNSYDLLLGTTLLRYTEDVLDPKKENDFELLKIDESGFIMKPGDFLLGSSLEKIGSDHYVPMIHAKSGIARKGLFIHCSTGLIDIGSHGNITFQLTATLPIVLYPKMKIAQVTFWKPKGKINLYEGKYQNSSGPKSSQTYKDFDSPSLE
jgi:dCTP deaminase